MVNKIILLALIFASLCVFVESAVNVTIFATGRVFGEWLPLDPRTHMPCIPTSVNETALTFSRCIGGAAKRAYALKQIRSLKNNVIAIDVGESFFGSVLYPVFGVDYIAALFQDMDYDVIGLGPRDFMVPESVLARFLSHLPNDIAILSTNVDFSSTVHLSQVEFKRFFVKNIDGIEIAFISSVSSFLASRVPYFPREAKVNPGSRSIISTIQQLIDDIMQSHSDIQGIILISSASTIENTLIAQGLKNLTMIISATDSVDTDIRVVKNYIGDEILIINTGINGESVFCSDFLLEDRKVVGRSNEQFIRLTEHFPSDPLTIQSNSLALPSVISFLHSPLQFSEDYLFGEQGTVSTLYGVAWSDTNLGRLITDSMIFQCSQCDLVMFPSGLINCSIPEGNITFHQILKAIPYSAPMSIIRMKGADILSMFKKSVWRNFDQGAELDSFPSVSGARFYYNPSPSISMEESLIEMQIFNNKSAALEPLQNNIYYVVGIPQSLRNSYAGIQNAMDIPSGAAISIRDFGTQISLSVAEFIQINEKSLLNYKNDEIRQCIHSSLPWSIAGSCRILLVDYDKMPICSERMIGYTISKCQSTSNKITISYFYNQSCDTLGGTILPQQKFLDCDHVIASSPSGSAIASWITLVAIFEFGLILMILYANKMNMQRVAQFEPWITIIAILGTFILTISASLFLDLQTSKRCLSFPWVTTSGYSIALAAIVCKSFRIYQITQGYLLVTRLRKLTLFSVFGFLLIVSVNIIWTLVDTPTFTTISIEFEYGARAELGTCSLGSIARWLCFSTFFFMGFIPGTFFCVKAWFSEGQDHRGDLNYVLFAFFSLVSFFILFLLAMESSPYISASSIASSSSILLIGCVLVSGSLAFPVWRHQFCWRSVVQSTQNASGLYGATVREILVNPITREFLRKIAMDYHCSNLIACWEDINEFEQLSGNEKDVDLVVLMHDKAEEIVQDYIQIGAKREVSKIPQSLRNELVRESRFCLESQGMPPRNMFHGLRQELEKTIKLKLIPTFLRGSSAVWALQTVRWCKNFDDLDVDYQDAILNYLLELHEKKELPTTTEAEPTEGAVELQAGSQAVNLEESRKSSNPNYQL